MCHDSCGLVNAMFVTKFERMRTRRAIVRLGNAFSIDVMTDDSCTGTDIRLLPGRHLIHNAIVK